MNYFDLLLRFASAAAELTWSMEPRLNVFVQFAFYVAVAASAAFLLFDIISVTFFRSTNQGVRSAYDGEENYPAVVRYFVLFFALSLCGDLNGDGRYGDIFDALVSVRSFQVSEEQEVNRRLVEMAERGFLVRAQGSEYEVVGVRHEDHLKIAKIVIGEVGFDPARDGVRMAFLGFVSSGFVLTLTDIYMCLSLLVLAFAAKVYFPLLTAASFSRQFHGRAFAESVIIVVGGLFVSPLVYVALKKICYATLDSVLQATEVTEGRVVFLPERATFLFFDGSWTYQIAAVSALCFLFAVFLFSSPFLGVWLIKGVILERALQVASSWWAMMMNVASQLAVMTTATRALAEATIKNIKTTYSNASFRAQVDLQRELARIEEDRLLRSTQIEIEMLREIQQARSAARIASISAAARAGMQRRQLQASAEIRRAEAAAEAKQVVAQAILDAINPTAAPSAQQSQISAFYTSFGVWQNQKSQLDMQRNETAVKQKQDRAELIGEMKQRLYDSAKQKLPTLTRTEFDRISESVAKQLLLAIAQQEGKRDDVVLQNRSSVLYANPSDSSQQTTSYLEELLLRRTSINAEQFKVISQTIFPADEVAKAADSAAKTATRDIISQANKSISAVAAEGNRLEQYASRLRERELRAIEKWFNQRQQIAKLEEELGTVLAERKFAAEYELAYKQTEQAMIRRLAATIGNQLAQSTYKVRYE